MIEEELSKIWKSSPQEEQVKFDKSRFILDVQSSVDDFYKQMKILYIREALGAFIAIPMFVVYAFLLPHILTKIGFIMVALSAGYILLVLKKSKDSVPDQFSLNYLEYLQATKKFLEKSKRHRETVLIWYMSPMVVSIWIAMVGFYLEDPGNLNGLLITVAITILVSIAIHFLNQKSAKKVVAPKLDKVNNLIKSLKA
ncbi:MAG: hypothetical protein Sapg2KO_07010 [Saprospiraceae bacterium]